MNDTKQTLTSANFSCIRICCAFRKSLRLMTLFPVFTQKTLHVMYNPDALHVTYLFQCNSL